MIERSLVPVTTLSSEKEEMFCLFENHFEGVIREQFEEDLKDKDWVILLREQKVLKGFSTLQLYEAEFQGEAVRVIYSGDTITDPSIWSSPALAQAWAKAIQTLQQTSSQKLYWLLISSGYRTYRFMSICWQEFYPRYDQATPPQIAQFMNNLAQKQFGEYYDSQEGIVRFPNPQILRPHLRNLPPEKLKDPHIAFFAQKMPNHGQGDELVCLTEISEANLTRAGLRLWRSKRPLSIPFPIRYSKRP